MDMWITSPALLNQIFPVSLISFLMKISENFVPIALNICQQNDVGFFVLI